MNDLKISSDFKLPAEAVTQTFALLAKRGVGKSYLAAVMMEEMLAAALHVVVADPVGVFWGLRAAANGKDPGLPIIVMGGDHGDVPLEAAAGKVVAEFVVETRSSVVLDLSLLRKGDQVRFMTDFAETLYHRNREPLHLVLDEADAFCPQRPYAGQERMLGAMQDLVRRGRARGIGVTLVTQRAAVLSKDVLTQVEVLVALRTIAPQDRDAIDAWIQAHDAHGQRAEFMASLASLPIGTAWFWSPGWLDVFRRVKVRARQTFDSSATPTVGKKASAPKALAPVDLEALKGRIAATIERAKQDDPKALRAEIARLTHELQKAARAPTIVEPVVREVPVLSAEVLAEVRRAGEALHDLAGRVEAAAADANEAAGKVARGLEAVRAAKSAPVSLPRAPTGTSPPFRETRRLSSGGGADLTPMAKAMLTALAQHPAGLTKRQVLVHTDYAASGPVSGTFAVLTREGWAAVDGVRLRITDHGLDRLGPFDPLPTGAALRDSLVNDPQRGPMEKAFLRVLFDAYPEGVAKGVILEKAGYKASGPVSGTFARIVARGYAKKVERGHLRAADELFSTDGFLR